MANSMDMSVKTSSHLEAKNTLDLLETVLIPTGSPSPIALSTSTSNQEAILIASYHTNGSLTLLSLDCRASRGTVRKVINWKETNWTAIKALDLNFDASQLIVVTQRVALILPFNKYMSSSEVPGRSRKSDEPISINLPSTGTITCCVWWRSTVHAGVDFCVFGTEKGDILFLDLERKKCIHTVHVQGNITNLYVVPDDRQHITYLLISARSNLQWRLLLEERDLDHYQNSTEQEMREMGFSFYGGQMYIKSIIQGGTTDKQSFLPHRFTNIAISMSLYYQYAKSCHLISGLDRRDNVLKIYDSTVSRHPLYEYNLPCWTDNYIYTDNLIFIYQPKTAQSNPDQLIVLANQLAEKRSSQVTSILHKADIYSVDLMDGEKIISMASINLSMFWYTELVRKAGLESCCSNQHTILEGCLIVTTNRILHIKPNISPEQLYLNQAVSESVELSRLERLTRIVPIDIIQLLTQAAEYNLSQGQTPAALNILRYAEMPVTSQMEMLFRHHRYHYVIKIGKSAISKNKSSKKTSILSTLSDLVLQALIMISSNGEGQTDTNAQTNPELREFLLYNQHYCLDLCIKLLARNPAHINLLINISLHRKFTIAALEGIHERSNFLLVDIETFIENSGFVHALYAFMQGSLLHLLTPLQLSKFLICLEDSCCTVATDLLIPYLHQIPVNSLELLAMKYHPCGKLFRKAVESRKRSASTWSNDNLSYAHIQEEEPVRSVSDEPERLTVFYINVWLTCASKIKQQTLALDDVSLIANKEDDTIRIENPMKARPLVCCSKKAYFTSGQGCYTWGSYVKLVNLNTQDRVPISTPAQLQLTEGLSVQAIACGEKHVLLLADGRLFGLGESRYGQIGQMEDTSTSKPVSIEFGETDNDPITDIACGRYHSLVITKHGRLYSWGWGLFGQLGHGSTDNLATPTCVKFPDEEQPFITSASGGHSHTVALDHQAQVWVFGSNAYGQLGVVADVDKIVTPVIVGLENPVSLVSTRYFATVVISRNEYRQQQIQLWGIQPTALRRKVQLLKNQPTVPRPSDTPNDPSILKLTANHIYNNFVENLKSVTSMDGSNIMGNIVQLATGSTHGLILTDLGKVYLWEENTSDKSRDPSRRLDVQSTPVVDGSAVYVSCDMGYSLILKSDGNILSFGNNDFGQLGLALRNIRHLPKPGTVKLPVSAITVTSLDDYINALEPQMDSLPAVVKPGSNCTELASLVKNGILNLEVVLSLAHIHKCYRTLACLYTILEQWTEACLYHLKSLPSTKRESDPSHQILSLVKFYLERVENQAEEQLQLLLLRVLQYWKAKQISIPTLENYFLSRKASSISCLSALGEILLGDGNTGGVDKKMADSFSTKFLLTIARAMTSLPREVNNSPSITSVIPLISSQLESVGALTVHLPPSSSKLAESVVAFTCGHDFHSDTLYQAAISEMKSSLDSLDLTISSEALSRKYINHQLDCLPCPRCIVRYTRQLS